MATTETESPDEVGRTTRVGMWLENRWWVIGTWVGAVAVALPSMYYEPNKGMDWFFWPVAGGLVLGIVAPLREAKKHERELAELGTKLTEEVSAASADATVLYGTILVPTMERLHTFTAAKGSVERARSYTDFVANLLGETAGFLATEGIRVKVNYYRLEDDGGRVVLRVVQKTRNVSREVFDETTEEGKAILRRTLEGRDEYCPDIASLQLSGAENLASRDYSCFLSASVKSAGVVYGMVSANADAVDGMPVHGMEYLKMIASILAVAEAYLGQAAARTVGDTSALSVSGGP